VYSKKYTHARWSLGESSLGRNDSGHAVIDDKGNDFFWELNLG